MRASEPFFGMFSVSKREEIMRLEIAQLELQVNDAVYRLDTVREMHSGSPYWEGEEYNTDGDPVGYVCLVCSDGHIEGDLENWEFDSTDGSAVPWPCPTYTATLNKETT